MSLLWSPSSGLSSSGEVFNEGMLDEKPDGGGIGRVVGQFYSSRFMALLMLIRCLTK